MDIGLLLDIRVAHVRERLGIVKGRTCCKYSKPEIESALLGICYADRSMPVLISDEPILERAWCMGDELVKVLFGDIATESNRGCGLVYELFAKNFSVNVDGLAAGLHPAVAEMLMDHARKSGIYYSRDEFEMMDAAAAEEGLCCHYLDADTCPCGCFEHE